MITVSQDRLCLQAKEGLKITVTTMLEEKTVRKMIELYCRRHHGTGKKDLCPSCAQLLAYCVERINKCPFGTAKPVCSKCSIHCYREEKRDHIRQVMRSAGPRMLFHSPFLTLRYLLRKILFSACRDRRARQADN